MERLWDGALLLVDPPHLVLDWFQCGMGRLLVVDVCVSLAMCVKHV